ncbi:aldo/keto reductase [candidate division KSB1 bacterium]
MKYRPLGKTGIDLPALGLGCMSMSEFYGERDDEESTAAIRRALDLGVTFLDTADVYGSGHNEELVGNAVRGRREQVFLASKCGLLRKPGGGWKGVNGTPEYVGSACRASLKRLGVDYIDLYYLHRVDPGVPVEETAGAMAELVREGKVRFIGLSETSPGTLRKAYSVHPVTAMQSEYSLWSRDPESNLLQTCRELDVTLIAYSPLGRGFLTGRITSGNEFSASDARRYMPRFRDENLGANRTLVRGLEKFAERKSCTAAQIALAWLLHKGPGIIPIPGTKKRRYLEENIAAVDLELTAGEVAELDRMFPPGAAAGQRYDDLGMSKVNL